MSASVFAYLNDICYPLGIQSIVLQLGSVIYYRVKYQHYNLSLVIITKLSNKHDEVSGFYAFALNTINVMKRSILGTCCQKGNIVKNYICITYATACCLHAVWSVELRVVDKLVGI